MIINDLHIKSVPPIPSEANAPLIINPDAVLAFTVPCKFLQTIARGYPQVSKNLRSVKYGQLALGGTLDSD